MADDWIKMRTDLYRDPKVCVLADLLLDGQGDLARYVSQHMQRDMTVTRNVMRNAIVGTLVTVWGVARRRGKRNGDDLRIDGVVVSVVDDMADLPGLGAAMEAVGWLEQDPLGLVFPNFFDEYNVENASKKKNAERQKRYRERKKAEPKTPPTGVEPRDVTVTSRNAPREEKRREEKNTLSHSHELLKSQAFSEQWERYIHHLWEGWQVRMGEIQAESLLMELGRTSRDADDAAAMIAYSIARGAKNVITNGDHRNESSDKRAGKARRKVPELEEDFR